MTEPTGSGSRAAGVLLAIGGVLFLIGLFVHPLGEELGEAQTRSIIVSQTVQWRVSHALVGFGTVFVAAAGLVLLAGRSPVASGSVAMAGWALFVVFSVPAFLVLMVESTVLVEVALAGDAARFHEWYGGLVIGVGTVSLSFLFLWVGLVAIQEARAASPLLPRWSAGLAAAGGFLSVGIPIGVVLQNPAGAVGYLGYLVAGAWVLALGIQLVRKSVATGPAAPVAGA